MTLNDESVDIREQALLGAGHIILSTLKKKHQLSLKPKVISKLGKFLQDSLSFVYISLKKTQNAFEELRKFFRTVCAEPVESAPSKTHTGQVVPTFLQEAAEWSCSFDFKWFLLFYCYYTLFYSILWITVYDFYP